MSLLGNKFEFTPFEVALRETVQWLLDHYDTDARIERRAQGNSSIYNHGAANGQKTNGTAAHVERVGTRVETIEVE
jgi:hypothetical protein